MHHHRNVYPLEEEDAYASVNSFGAYHDSLKNQISGSGKIVLPVSESRYSKLMSIDKVNKPIVSKKEILV